MEKKEHDISVMTSGLHVVLDIMNEVERVVTEELEIHPRFPDLHNRLGLIRFKQGKFAAARASFEAAVSINRGYFAGKANLGYALMELGRAAEAESMFADALEKETRPHALAGMACLRMKEKKLDEAATLFKEAAACDPRSALYPHNLGIVCFLLGKYEEALAHLGEAEKLCPPYGEIFAEARLVVGGRPSVEAFREYVSEHELNPFLFELHDHLGHAYAANGLFAEAAGEYRFSVRTMPSLANYYGNLALIESAQDKEQESLQHLLKAVDSEPDSVKARVSLAFEYSARGLAPEAVEQFEAARALKPRYPDIRYNLSLLYLEMGRQDEAVEELHAALKANPGYLFARNSLAFALFKRGEFDAALEEYRKVVAGGLCSSDILVNMGMIYREKGTLQKAIDSFDKAISLNPNYAPAYYQLGLAYQAKGQKEKTRWAWKAYLERAQEDGELEDVKKTIKG
jgi:tetratricopeptide (TPR) repeat protein